MKSPEWLQQVLLLTADLEVKAKIVPAFGQETNFTVIADPASAIEWMETHPLQVLIVDAKAAESVSFLELSQYASQLNHRLTVIVLIDKMLSKQADFAEKCGASVVMDRKDISLDVMVYIIRVLRKRTFRTVLCRDLETGLTPPVDLYHFLPSSNHYAVFLAAGTSLTHEKQEKLYKSHVKHLYVLETDCEKLFTSLRTQTTSRTRSERLHQIREELRGMLREFFNMGSHGNVHVGKKMLREGQSIVANINDLIQAFPDLYSCLEELPYPRWSPLAHCLNCIVYCIIFSGLCEVESTAELALAALFHNIGLAEIKQEILKKGESDMTSEEHTEYSRHVFRSIEIIKQKMIPITSFIEASILYHHENYDGSGFPEGLAQKQIPTGAALLSILGSFDYFKAIRSGQQGKSAKDAWNLLKASAKTGPTADKFDPNLIAAIDPFFQTWPEQA